jgi:hypothetical protein
LMVALFITAKTWKRSGCASKEEWITVTHLDNGIYNSAPKKKKKKTSCQSWINREEPKCKCYMKEASLASRLIKSVNFLRTTVSFYEILWNSGTVITAERLSGCQELGKGRMSRWGPEWFGGSETILQGTTMLNACQTFASAVN